MVNRLTGAGMEGRHPFLKKRSQAGIVVLCVITSDTGLCGTYNSAVIGKAEEFINSRACTGARVRIAAIGKRGLTYFSKRGCDIVYSCVDSNGRFDRARAEAISDELSRLFSANEASG
jgi:F-type H+-transporting ATPase subunit gamma